MLRSILRRVLGRSTNDETLFPEEYLEYASYAYPSNHTYKIESHKLTPYRQLAHRYKAIRSLLPSPLTSLADIGSSKGFFVFAASDYPNCNRALGIDINEYDIVFCKKLQKYLKNACVQFQLLKLDELAENIQKFGGPFQTVLVINLYQYLYFGSDRSPCRYLDHNIIFEYLRAICSGRIIFNNRISLEHTQNDRWVKEAYSKAKQFNEASIKDAASRYFTLREHGYIGKYPLLTMDVDKTS